MTFIHLLLHWHDRIFIRKRLSCFKINACGISALLFNIRPFCLSKLIHISRLLSSNLTDTRTLGRYWTIANNFTATYSNIPVAEVSCVCSDKAWCPLATVNVDSNQSTLRQIHTCVWNGNGNQILPGIPIFGIDSSLPSAGALWNLWSYVFCKGAHSQELSVRIKIYIINQEKTPLQMDITAAMLSLSLYRIILTYLCFLVIVFKCVYYL